MKTFKWIILFVLLVIVSFGVYAWSLWSLLKKIKFRVVGAKIKNAPKVSEINILDITKILNLEIEIQAELQNYASRDFKINNFQIELFSEDGQLLAKQTQPLEAIIVKSQQTEALNIPIVVKVVNIAQTLFNNANIDTILNLVALLNTGQGKLNKKLIAKGFVRIENIPFAYNFEETFEI
jgi:carbonic anhydrase